MAITLCKILVCSVSISGVILFIIGIFQLPGGQTQTIQSGETTESLQQKNTDMIVHSKAFLLTMIGIGLGFGGFILWWCIFQFLCYEIPRIEPIYPPIQTAVAPQLKIVPQIEFQSM